MSKFKLCKKKLPNYKTQYEPHYTKNSDVMIEDIRESLKEINKSQVTIDTLDICILLGKIDYLQQRISKAIECLKCNYVIGALRILKGEDNGSND